MLTGDRAGAALAPLVERFRGRTALIFAPGPSLPHLWDPLVPCDLPKIAVNKAYEIVPNADILYATDNRFWTTYNPQVTSVRVGYESCAIDGVIPLEGTGAEGYDDRLGYIRHGGNSGYCAAHLAGQLGARVVALVGFDMRPIKGKHRFHGEHHPATRNVVPNNYELWCVRMVKLALELRQRGCKLVSATPNSGVVHKFVPAVDLAALVNAG